MDNDIYIWLDESGTLSKNKKNPQTYVYAGYWCLKRDLNLIESQFTRRLITIFPSCKTSEKKASSMKNNKKKKLIKFLIKDNPNKFHPIFLMEKIDKMEKPLDNKKDIQLQKNYLLRRFVEMCVNDYRSIYPTLAKNVYVNIDDQSRTNLIGFDPFPIYLTKYFNGEYFRNSYTISSANFIVKFKDSKKYRSIQICDLLANCKYHHYVHGRQELNDALAGYPMRICKLPS